MKIPVKLDYTCRILCELARQHADGTPVSIDQLAKAEAVPANFLAQILGELRNGRLVVSRRGVQGGFLLARPPEEVTLLDILSVIEGELIGLSGNHGGRSGQNLRRIWTEIGEAAADRARAITLEQMAARADASMYYI